MNPTLAAALDLRGRGLPVLPLDGKQPHVRALRAVHGVTEWAPFRDRPASAPEITAWFEHFPAANVGVIVPPGLVVVDVDRPELFEHTHPPTPSAATGRGRHLYFRGTVEGVVRTPWGELRGTGSYVVAPPSIHPSTGTAYRWEITPDLADFADLPSWAAEYADTTPTNGTAPSTNVGTRGTHSASTYEPSAKDPRAVASAMRRMGRPEAINAQTGRTPGFRCLLVEHRDTRPSAGLYVSEHGAFRYRCHGCGANLSLARLFASVVIGRRQPDTMPAPTAACWLARLWHEAGVRIVEPPVSELPNVSATARTVAAGFLLLAAVRTDDDPVPFTAAFASAWCGVSVDQAKRALRELRTAGWLVPTGPSRRGVGFLYWPPAVSDDATAVIDVVAAPDRALPLEPAGVLVGAQPRRERGNVRVVDRTQLGSIEARPPTPRRRTHPRICIEVAVLRRGSHARKRTPEIGHDQPVPAPRHTTEEVTA